MLIYYSLALVFASVRPLLLFCVRCHDVASAAEHANAVKASRAFEGFYRSAGFIRRLAFLLSCQYVSLGFSFVFSLAIHSLGVSTCDRSSLLYLTTT